MSGGGWSERDPSFDSELSQSNPGGLASLPGAFLSGFKLRRSVRSFSVLYVVKKTFSLRSLRNEANPRDTRPRAFMREIAPTPGMFFGLRQLFNRTTAISLSVRIGRSPLSSCSRSGEVRATNMAALRHPVNARSFTTFARSWSIFEAVE